MLITVTQCYTSEKCQKTKFFYPIDILGQGRKEQKEVFWIIFNDFRGKNENESTKRELIFKEDGQEYALVTKMLGNGWVEANCVDGTKRLAHIRGAFRKRVW